MQQPVNVAAEPLKVDLVPTVVEQLVAALAALEKLEPQVAAQKAVVETIVHTALAQSGYDIKTVKGVSFDKENNALTFTK